MYTSFSKSLRTRQWFTLVELIVVITTLAILATVGFVVMSHQTSVARDGKRISEIQSLSSASRITTAQLRELPRPIADSLELTVSGSFIGYQGFMSKSLVNPIGYGSDKIYDPLDGTPYTYRVSKNYDQAQFMAYLENPRFERSIEIAKNQFLRNEEVGMNGGWFDGNQGVGMNGFGGWFDGKKIQEIASQSLTSALSSTLSSTLPSLFSQAYALDSSTTDLSSRYPYSAGDRLGIFVSKGSNQPLQNGVTGTGSRDISLSDSSTLRIIVGSSWADGYVSTDISTWSLLSLKDGSFDEKALLGMNGGSSGSGSGSGGGGESPCSSNPTADSYFTVVNGIIYGYDINWPKNVSIPAIIGGQNITGIGIYAFNNKQLTCVDIPNGVTNIGIGAFSSNQIASIAIPSSVTSIWTHAFEQNQLTSIIIPSSVTSIGMYTFNSNQLTSVVIPSSVVSIWEWAFWGNQLTSIVIPNSVTSIEISAFYWNKFTSVVIPSSVTSIGADAFGGQNNSAWNGTVYGPSSGYIKSTYTINSSWQFDKTKLTNYVDTP